MYQHAPNNIRWSFPPPPHRNGPSAPNHSPETLVADMWRTCPSLCASIQHDFDLNVIFHPALVALHGETFLRLAASQIVMQNQAAEMTHMRNALSQKQKVLNVNSTSAKDLLNQLVTQQSELKEIKGLLEQDSQSLTSPDRVKNEQSNGSYISDLGYSRKGPAPAPTTTQASSLASIDGSMHNFYRRSADLPHLQLGTRFDDAHRHDEKHGYGHAETKGPAFQYDRVEEDISGSTVVQPSDQQSPEPPGVSTSTIFELVPATTNLNLSPAATKQTLAVEEKKDAGSTVPEDHTFAVGSTTTSAPFTIMKRDPRHQSALQIVNTTADTSESEVPNEKRDTTSATPSKKDCKDTLHENRPSTSTSKPASYAAAVRTTPSTTSLDDAPVVKVPTTTAESSPAPDLGFTLEPLPKPTIQQVQSQQKQQVQSPRMITQSEDAPEPHDFYAGKNLKMAAGTWEGQPQPPHVPHQYAHQYPHQHQQPHRPRQAYQPNSTYRGSSRRFQQHNNYYRSGPMTEEQKQEWLAWKQNLISQGKWNPMHPFRQAWKNE